MPDFSDTRVLIPIGLVYAVIFWIVGRKYPQIPLMLIFASAPFQNDISGGGPLKFSIAEVNLLLTLPLFFAMKRPLRLSPVGIPIALYLGVCVVSTALTLQPGWLASVVQRFLYYVAAVVVFAGLPRNEKDYLPSFIGLICVCVVLSVVGIASHSPYYLGLHKNGVGASLSCASVICAEMIFSARSIRARMLYGAAAAVIVAGLIFTLSRGAWLAALVGLVIIMALRRQFTLLWRGGIILIPVTLICWQMMPAESRDYATDFSRERYSIAARYESKEFAQHLFESSPILGVGVGLGKAYDATNLTWLTLAETGVAGLAALLLIHAVFFLKIWQTQKYLNRSSLRFSVLAIGGALMIGRLAHGQVDHYWSRGAIMIACASMGMSIHAQLATRKQLAQARRKRALEEAAREEASAALVSHCT